MSSTQPPLIPIYTSKGDAEAFLLYPYIFNRGGDWIGFVTPQREVYSVLGSFVGTLTNDPRIVGKRTTSTFKPRLEPPPTPQRVRLPATVHLPPMMAELSYSVIDILLEAPERLHTVDSGESRQDLD
jgi:hypothetical protein